MTEPHSLNLLPIGTELAEYTITGVLGEGGFGIVYRAEDRHLGREVAIKEYLPSAIAGRASDQSVRVRSVKDGDAFRSGQQSFLREARMLAKFVDPSLVFVYRVWEERGTAYFSMRLCPGQTLREVRLSMDEGMAESDIALLLSPILHALERLHEQDIIHRDVSPDNIIISENAPPVLLDLGAARQQIGGMTSSLTSILKPGYAPIEQYADDGSMKQGPWTDVYALGALIYFLATGRAPMQSVMRVLQDGIKPIALAGDPVYSQRLLDAVRDALAIQPAHRIQSIASLRERLGWNETRPQIPAFNFPTNRGAGASTTANPNSQSVSVNADPEATIVMTSPRQATIPPASPTASLTNPVSERVAPQALTAPDVAPSQAMVTPGRNRWPIAAGLSAVAVAIAGGLWVARPTPETVVAAKATPAAATPLPGPVSVPKPEQSTAAASKLTPLPTLVTPPVAVASQPVKDASQPVKDAPEPVKAATPQPAPAKIEAPTKPAPVKSTARVPEKVESKTAIAATVPTKPAAVTSSPPSTNQTGAIAIAPPPPPPLIPPSSALPTQPIPTYAEPRKDPRDATAKATDAKKAEPNLANQTVNDLAALAMKSYKDGRIADARGYWARLAAMPEASARSRALAHANSARTYCSAGDSASCEKFFRQALRADPSWRLSDADASRAELQLAWRNAQGK